MYANPLTKQSTVSDRPTRLRSVVGSAAAAVLVAALAAPGVAHAQEDDQLDIEGAVEYEVQSGDSLAEIAAEHGLEDIDSWRDIFDANPKLEDPDLIVPGQVLVIPPEDADLERRELPAATVVQSSTTTSSPQQQAGTTSSAGAGVWDRLAQCESGGNWSINTGNGYYGGLQFSLSSWQAVGGSGYPHEASKSEQIRRGEMLRAKQGWGAWPACSSKLGLR